MKTILDKVPLKVSAGRTESMRLPEVFRIKDCMFLIVHNSLNETLKITISNPNGHSLIKNVTLHSFPTIVVFPECIGEANQSLNELEYDSVSFTSFEDLEGSLTFRVKVPAQIIAAYKNQ